MNRTGRSLLLPAALLVALVAGPGLSEDKDPPTPPQVYRTFMPGAGPSAFGVVLAPYLALCYDPLRGGVNQSWQGTLDLAPTLRAKINEPATIAGTVFYEESILQPLRIEDPETVPERRFKGYRYADGAVIFDYTLDGVAVSEALRITSDGDGVERAWMVAEGGHTFYFLAEEQSDAEVVFTGGTKVSPGLWKFETGTDTDSPAPFAMTMQAKTKK
ncbi:MAG: hypothetical protein GXX91_07435 [Verrucomicrobiaceae bacterium]|nr:hypothetical protein [Verrucomicrobiaceae bacterium]